MTVSLKLAWRYMSGRGLRSALTTLAVVFGVMLIFGLNGVTQEPIVVERGGHAWQRPPAFSFDFGNGLTGQALELAICVGD